jgi:hypothetical protein
MATIQDHNEGIRLQAERVVRAYQELRDSAASVPTMEKDWPVGLFAELVQQIKLLDGWLKPVGGDAPPHPKLADGTSPTVRRAAEEVIGLYRATGWDALAGERSGGYKALPELEEALGRLDRALEVNEEAPSHPRESYAVIYMKDTDVHTVLYGLHGIAKALESDAIDANDAPALHSALLVLASKLYNGVYDLAPEVQKRAIRKLAEEVSA